MSALERLAATGGNGIGQYSFVDADTVKDAEGNSYRIEGFDAPEIAGFKGGEWTGGTSGGTAANSEIQRLMSEQGYHNMVKETNEDGSPKMDATGNRQIVRFQNSKGEDFTTKLLSSGALRTNKYTDQDQLDAIEVDKVFRNQSEDSGAFHEASKKIRTLIDGKNAENLMFKQAAVSEAAYDSRYNTSALDFRKTDRDIRNNSYNNIGDSWDMGVLGAKEGMYGMLELLGETTGSEWLNDIGEAGIARAKSKTQEFGHVLTDYKDVDSFKTGMQFLGNNIAMSLPYMGITAASAAVGSVTAPVIGGAAALAVGLTAPSAVYAGQTWNEMEGEKSASIAVASGLVQASLDRLGLGVIAGKLIPDRAFNQGVEAIMKKQGVNKQVASEILSNATKQESRLLIQEAAKAVTKQQRAKTAFLDLVKRTSISGGTEAVTEAMQEATAYLSAVAGSDKVINWEELNQRMITAAITGGAIGGALGAPSAIKQSVLEQDILVGAQKAGDDTASVSQQYAAEEKADKGYVPSVDENLAEVSAHGQSFAQHEDRAKRYRDKHKAKSFTTRAAEAALNPQALWQGATRNIFTPELQAKSRAARQLADSFGGNLQRIYSGANFETFKHGQVSRYKNMVMRPEAVYSVMGRGKRATASVKENISNTLYAKMKQLVDKDGNIDPNLLDSKDPDYAMILQTATDLNIMAEAMWNDQKKYNPKLGKINNYLMQYKALDKKAVKQNKTAFQDLLVRKHNYSRSDAAELTQRLVEDPEVNDIDEAFSVIKGGIRPDAHKKRQLGLSSDAEFNDFMQKDLFANVAQAAKSAARYTAHQKFIGNNSEVISKFLDQMEKEGVPEAEVDKVAAQMQDYLDAESGNYKRPQTTAGKKAQTIQKNLMAVMTLSGLPLATISSFVELMLVNRGLTSEQVWGKDGSMKAMGKEFADTIKSGMAEITSVATGKDLTRFDPQSAARQKMQELGFYDWDVGAATVTGVTEVNAWQQKFYEGFFKATGLTGWTNYTRAARASMAADFMMENADIVWAHKVGQSDYTRDVQQAEEKLRNLGINVEKYTEIQTKATAGMQLTPEEQTFLDQTVNEATFNFVNEAIALPNASNRPLIYQDPRFALFTQFQGFIATFTANHIPKLWGEYVKRGTPAMKYNAFATMATMIMVGFMSQALKDWIKYEAPDFGEDDYDSLTGQNPYLTRPEYIRRGIMASGLLGTAERPLNFAFPVYGNNAKGAGDWAFNSAIGESPGLGWIERAGRATGAFLEGDVGKGTEQSLKAAPIFGPFSAINKQIGKVASGWNFNGE